MIHILQERGHLPDLRFVERGGERWHPGETHSMVNLPIRYACRVIFDAVRGELRRLLIETVCDVARFAVGDAMTDRAVCSVQLHAGDEICRRGGHGIVAL